MKEKKTIKLKRGLKEISLNKILDRFAAISIKNEVSDN